jgi:hypothetical protein
MKDIPTPISDSAVSDDFYCSGMVDVDVSRDLEKRLAIAVAALKEIYEYEGLCIAGAIAKEALAQIEEKK